MATISRIPRRLLWLLASVALFYLVACVLLFVFQRSLIYVAQPNAIPAEILELHDDDATVRVLVRPHAGRAALIYFGGNAEDVSRNLPSFAEAFPDRALYLLNYRGFGGSSGSPSEASIDRDALALFDKIHAAHADIAIVGRSLGTGAAIRLASERPVSRLVLITPYDSLLELARSRFPLFPVKWMLKDTFESWRYASLITVPTLLIAAEQDEIIPRASSERLYAHFNKGVASLQVIPGEGHNTVSDSPQYLKLISEGL